MAGRLGRNQYGKAEVRVVAVDRSSPRHRLVDLNVSTSLRGDFTAAHTAGDNAHVLPTDTQKNTVFAFARDGVLAYAVSPGWVGTELAADALTDAEARDSRSASPPQRRTSPRSSPSWPPAGRGTPPAPRSTSPARTTSVDRPRLDGRDQKIE